eukprot:Blabericola_migrator_1__4295@NODE_2319_length_2943_cov_262_305633_g1454_i0_p5_GENE_NODE_2319_length_2943_cov_262_305633_g1454_i0NODE_2319_length_2943_cov_262_305633_g1454_i0_p5_ORF_typecomplete_len115_score10_97DNA_methylase/PF00145_17/0_11_NODE_2319_length_2943_cov_262_305633_g1454_i015841928
MNSVCEIFITKLSSSLNPGHEMTLQHSRRQIPRVTRLHVVWLGHQFVCHFTEQLFWSIPPRASRTRNKIGFQRNVCGFEWDDTDAPWEPLIQVAQQRGSQVPHRMMQLRHLLAQ